MKKTQDSNCPPKSPVLLGSEMILQLKLKTKEPDLTPQEKGIERHS